MILGTMVRLLYISALPFLDVTLLFTMNSHLCAHQWGLICKNNLDLCRLSVSLRYERQISYIPYIQLGLIVRSSLRISSSDMEMLRLTTRARADTAHDKVGVQVTSFVPFIVRLDDYSPAHFSASCALVCAALPPPSSQQRSTSGG